MWCLFYVGFIGDRPSILLCKHDPFVQICFPPVQCLQQTHICRIVKSTHNVKNPVKSTRKVNSTTKFVDFRRIVKSTHQREEPSKKH